MTRECNLPDEIEITPEMIEAGADAVLGFVGGADLGGHFSASEMAIEVYRAMVNAGLSGHDGFHAQNPKE